jgi:hypothetical protein
MYKRKADAKERGDGVEELLYKLLQNSLYGKAGQKEIIHSFKLLDNDKIKAFELMNKTDIKQEFGNKTLVRTQGKIDAELEGVIIKGLEEQQESLYDDEEIENKNVESKDFMMPPRKKHGVKSSVSIAAAITAYARINMSQYKNIKGNKYLGGDTDSAIMEKELSPQLVGKGLGMMKEECRLLFGLFADKKLYLMKDVKGNVVVKSRGVGKEDGYDILNYHDFLKLFKGEVLNIFKKKFRIKPDGIYYLPQAISVKLRPDRLLKVKEELKEILDNIMHPLYKLAREIEAVNITALMVHCLRPLDLRVVTYDFTLVNNHIISYLKGVAALILFILYVTKSAKSLYNIQ